MDAQKTDTEISNLINQNIIAHDKIAKRYDELHCEIYNSIEQDRIRETLSYAFSSIRSTDSRPVVLDFGAGTGNLTLHLLELGAEVVAADVSSKSLDLLKGKISECGDCVVVLCNGTDLAMFQEQTFDMVVTYSVLHHVPDYQTIVREFSRVLKRGGIVYIDHEACPSFWQENPRYQMYISCIVRKEPFLNWTRNKLAKIFDLRAWRRLARRKILGKIKYNSEQGDIHVYPDDHIEWTRIHNALSCFEILLEEDYLVCRGRDFEEMWRMNKNILSDMRVFVARKTQSTT